MSETLEQNPANTLLDLVFSKYGEEGTTDLLRDAVIAMKISADYLYNELVTGDLTTSELKVADIKKILEERKQTTSMIRGSIMEIFNHVQVIKMWYLE